MIDDDACDALARPRRRGLKASTTSREHVRGSRASRHAWLVERDVLTAIFDGSLSRRSEARAELDDGLDVAARAGAVREHREAAERVHRERADVEADARAQHEVREPLRRIAA